MASPLLFGSSACPNFCSLSAMTVSLTGRYFRVGLLAVSLFETLEDWFPIAAVVDVTLQFYRVIDLHH